MKSWLFRLGLIFIGLIVGVIAGEVIARVISPNKSADLLFNSPDSSPMGLYILDEQVRLKPAANFQSTVRSLDYTVSLRTNEIGLRGPSLGSIEGEQWIALGDSFTMSVQVAEEDSFHALLGKNKSVHIWNGGVDGYSTWQATKRLQQITPKININHLILTFFTGNDFQDNERYLAMKNTRIPGQNGDPIPREKVSAWTSFLLRSSYVYAHYRIWHKQQAIENGLDHSRQNWQDELKIFTKKGAGRLQHLKQKSKQALLELKRLTLQQNISLTVAVAPPAFVVDQDRIDPTFTLVGLSPTDQAIDAPQQTILAILKELKIASCDLTDSLRQAEKNSPTYFTYDGHWTPHGHHAVAEQLYKCIGN
jgi:hypothetical protein